MSPPWYVARGKEKVGPYAYLELRQMATSGQLLPSDMVLNEGATQWVSADLVPGLTFASQKDSPSNAESSLPPGNWYVAMNGQRVGPFTVEQFRQMLESGLLSPVDMVLNEEVGRWVSAGAVQGPFPQSADLFDEALAVGRAPQVAACAPLEVNEPRPTKRDTGVRRDANDFPSPRRVRSARSLLRPVNVVLAVAALLSIPFFCLNEILGKPFAIVAGLIWLVVGGRAIVTGSVPSFTGQMYRRPVLYRVGGVFITFMGLCLVGSVLEHWLRERAAQQAVSPGKPTPANKDVARLLVLGFEEFKREEYEKAENTFNEAIRLAPAQAEGYVGRGAVHLARGEFDKAIADCTEAIKRDPRLALAYSKRGGAYKQKGDADKAIADCTEAIRLNPEDSATFIFRAGAYFLKEQDDKAIADYTQAIRLSPMIPALHVARASLHLGKGELDRAIADCTEAIRLDERNAEAYRLRSKAHRAKGDDELANLDGARANRLAPDKP